MEYIRLFLGQYVKLIYNGLSHFSEPKSISFFAISIIIATFILKLVLLPLSFSQIKNQKKMSDLQPELEKLKVKYKNDPQTFAQKQQQLYKSANVNMLGGCLPMIVQLLILLAFYRVFMFPTKYVFTEPGLYDTIQKNFFYIPNVDHPDKTIILPIIAGVSTFLSTYLAQKANPQQNQQGAGMMTTMSMVMPIVIFSMARKFAAGLVLYWIVSNLFQLIQQFITNVVIKKEEEDVLNKDS